MRRLCLLLVACGPPQYNTVADACYALAGTVCQRLTECGASPASDCRATQEQTCCGTDAICAMPVKDQSFVANCDAAIRSASCGDIIANNTPAACK